MHPGRFAVVASFGGLVSLAIACGGSVASPPGSSGTSTTSSGGSSTSTSSSSSGGGACSTAPVAGNRACVPGIARANASITLAVDATDGCLGCFTTLDPCKVTVSGNAITLAMSATTCQPVGDRECPAVCLLPSGTCTLPPLAAGEYAVAVAAETSGGAVRPRTLVVTNDALATSCDLIAAGMKPEPLDGEKYARACSRDDDCAIVTTGDVCHVCSCPDATIAKSAMATYEADYRARSSQCATPDSAIPCEPCKPRTAVCSIKPDALTGTCVLTPL